MEDSSTTVRFDRFRLRVALFAAAAALLAGNAAVLFWNRGAVAGRWIVFSALLAGLFLALAYETDVLLRRLRLTLAAWAFLFLAHATAMALVSSSFGWQSEAQGEGGGAPFSMNMLLLAAAALCMLMRAGIVALCSARWLPQFMVRVVPSERRPSPDAIVMRDELAIPRPWVFLIYFASPVAWWLLLSLGFQSVLLPQPSAWRALGLFVSMGLLIARLALGAWVAGCAWRDARSAGGWALPIVQEARWFAFYSGLPAAGLLGFYLFFFSAGRVQYDALASLASKEDAKASAALRVLLPPLDPKAPDARPFLAQAESAYAAPDEPRVFRDAWELPAAVMFLRGNARTLAALKSAAREGQGHFLPDPLVDADTYLDAQPNPEHMARLVQALMLDARWAARGRNFGGFQADFAAALNIAACLRAQPFIEGCLAENLQVQTIALSALPALLFDPAGAPDDEALAKAQKLLRGYEARRGRPLAHALEARRLEAARWFAHGLARSSSAWPGEPDVPALALAQPVFVWTLHDGEIQWYRQLAAAALRDDMPMALRELESTEGLQQYLYNRNLLIEDVWKEQDTLCHLRLADAAIGVFRHRRARGAWPRTLGECVPEFLESVPADPYRPGREVGYDQDPLRVYSCGHDGVFNEHLHERSFENTSAFAMGLSGRIAWGNRVLYLDPPRPKSNLPRNANRAVAILIEDEARYLAAGDARVRKRTFLKLYDAGPRAYAALKEILALAGDADPEIRMWVACVLGALGPSGGEQAETLDRLAEDRDPDVARYAAEALREVRPIKAAP
ncbi:MAG: hypothetical protein HY291_11960 [Planctomycetes bacterium]|nr:hypothetical protein [Planctomycetota bacterium]